MPRIARQTADEGVYHILNRGNGRQPVFHKDGDYLTFMQLLGQMCDQYAIELYAYCLMPNHFPLLVKVGKGEDLSRGMQWFMTTHVRRYHRHYHSSGHLWQGRYKSFGIREDDHLLTVARYVEGNPVRAGLVNTASDWVWSSHRERCGLDGLAGAGSAGACPPRSATMIAPLPVETEADWTAYVDTPMTGVEIGKVRRAIERQGMGKAEGL